MYEELWLVLLVFTKVLTFIDRQSISGTQKNRQGPMTSQGLHVYLSKGWGFVWLNIINLFSTCMEVESNYRVS